MARPRSTQLEAPEATGEATATQEAPEAAPRSGASPRGSRGPGERTPAVSLPTERTVPTGELHDKTVLIHGPPKVGKSTLANEFGDVFFFDTEGGLEDLPVYRSGMDGQPPITDWPTFLSYCQAYADQDRFTIACIDTVDMLSVYCSAYTNRRLGIVHESDLEWGKGWSVKRDEFQRALAKLAALPGRGLIMISHSKDVEIKQRNRTITKTVPDLTGAARDAAVGMADLILFADFEGEGEDERRVLRTKPSAFYEAGERGRSPRLPATIDLSYAALAEAWAKGGKDE